MYSYYHLILDYMNRLVFLFLYLTLGHLLLKNVLLENYYLQLESAYLGLPYQEKYNQAPIDLDYLATEIK